MWSAEPLWDLLISSTDGEPHINCPYLTTAIPPVTSAHLNVAEKAEVFAIGLQDFPSFLLPLMPAPTPLRSDNQLWPFSPRIPSDYRLFFQPQGKNAPCPQHGWTRPAQRLQLKTVVAQEQVSRVLRKSNFSIFLSPGCLLLLSPLVIWVGGLLVQLGS